MAKNTLHQIQEIAGNVERIAGSEIAQKVMAGSEKLSETTKPEKVAAWMRDAIDQIDQLVDSEARNQIMLNCGYNCALANTTPIKRAIARRNKFYTEMEFLEAEQKTPPPGTRLVLEGKTIYQYYTPRLFTHPMRCYCSLFRKLPDGEKASITYCQCSRGFVQKYWEGVLGRPVQVELLSSSISGADECKFAIQLSS